MLRTWPVRLSAIRLTLSVRSFQVPPTPSTRAWPPSLPSVPTSRATRVTSELKEASWPTMVLTILPIRRNSPRSGRPSISTFMDWVRSPLATAPMTRATSAVGWTRSSISSLTERRLASQLPEALPTRPRSLMRPSLPTTRPSRLNSVVIWPLSSTTSLKLRAISASRPSQSSGRRTEKSPRRKARMAAAIVWRSRFLRCASVSMAIPPLAADYANSGTAARHENAQKPREFRAEKESGCMPGGLQE